MLAKVVLCHCPVTARAARGVPSGSWGARLSSPRVLGGSLTPGVSPQPGREPVPSLPLTELPRAAFIKWIFLQTTRQTEP